MKLRSLMASVLLATSVVSAPALAENYPERPIELIVPFGAGGTTDVFARAFSRVIDKYLPNEQTVVVINKPGGASTIGMGVVAHAEPDGYTLGFAPVSVIEMQHHYGRTSWKLDSFEPILSFLEIPVALNVLDSSPIKSFDDWLAFAKENPGKFTYTTSGGNGSSTHLSMVRFSEVTDTSIRHIPFEGAAASQAAVMAGQVMGNFSLPDQHKGGNIRPLLFLTDVKPDDPIYDDVPFAKDVGIDITVSYPMGIVAPKGVPAERRKVVHDAFKAAMADPEVVNFFKTANILQVYNGPEALQSGMLARSDESARLLRKMGLID